jgi:hypothetical protein
MQDGAEAVLTAIAQGVADGANACLTKLRQYATTADPAYAENADLDYVGQNNFDVPRGLHETDLAYRTRMLLGSDSVTPVALAAAINAILAPFTATQTAYLEHPDDDGYVFPIWDSYLVHDATWATGDGVYLFPQAANAGFGVSDHSRIVYSPHAWVSSMDASGAHQGTWRIPPFPVPGQLKGEFYVDANASGSTLEDTFVFPQTAVPTADGNGVSTPSIWSLGNDATQVISQIQALLETATAFGIKIWVMLDPAMVL